MTSMQHRARSIRAAARHSKTLSVCMTVAVLIGTPLLSRAYAGDVPTFAVDPSWPKALPNNWTIGQVGGITTDSQGISGSSIARVRSPTTRKARH